MTEHIFLARCLSDFNYSNENSIKIAHFYQKDLKNIPHLYKDRSHYINLNFTSNESLVLNWFKDDDKKDLTLFNSISWGNILACGLIQAISYCYREYSFLKNLNLSTLKVSDKEDILFLEVAEHIFKDKLELYAGFEDKNLTDTTIKRHLQPPRNGWKYEIFSMTTFLKTYFNRNKNLVIADGATIDFYNNKENFIFLNTKKINQSVYHNFKRNSKIAEEITPKWIFDSNFYLKCLLSYNKRNNFHFEEDFLFILSKIFVLHAKVNLNQIQDWICYYIEVLKKFNPKEVHFPGEKVEFYCAGAEVANSMGIKTVLLSDGINTLEKPIFLKKPDGRWLFDEFIVFDELSYNALARSGVSKTSIIQANDQHPLVNKMIINNKKTIYDVAIFVWIPFEYNSYCFPDLLPQILEKMILELKNKKIKIAVKFKNDYIKKIYLEQIDQEIIENVSIYSGPSTEVMPLADTIITGASTAIFEAKALGKKVILFEPKESGFCEEILNNDLRTEFKFCSNIEEILQMI